MKPFYFHWKGHRYKVQPAGVILLVAVLVIAVCLIILPIVNRSRASMAKPAQSTAEPTYDAAANVIDVTKYEGTILAETQDAGQDYIDSTLFLGDSNTARFMRITGEDGSTFTTKNNTIGVVGMGIDAISTLKCMQFSTGTFTMPDAVKILQPQRVIITFGTNNLSGSSTDATSFIDRYSAQIQEIEDAYPSVDIIVNSIPPVAKNRTYTNVTMTQIDAYNKAIATMCQDKDWKYLNSAETLKDSSSGYAKEGYTISDGLHLSTQGLTALFTYIRTHAWITEDDRPKPLASIPTIVGVPDGLIRTDPLTNEDFTEDPATEGDTSTESGCLSAYGTWDATTSTCSWPPPTPSATVEPTAQSTAASSTAASDNSTTDNTTPTSPPPSQPASSSPADSPAPTETTSPANTESPAAPTNSPAASEPAEAAGAKGTTVTAEDAAATASSASVSAAETIQ